MGNYDNKELTTKQLALEQVQRILESSGRALEKGGRNIHQIRSQVRMLEGYLAPHLTQKYKTRKKKLEKKIEKAEVKEPLDEFNMVVTHFSILMKLLAELRWLDYVDTIDEHSNTTVLIGE